MTAATALLRRLITRRRHVPTRRPRPWLANVTGSPLAEAQAR